MDSLDYRRESVCVCFFFFSSRRRHTRYWRDWSSDVCSSDLPAFRLGTADGVRRGVHFMATEPCLVAYRLRSEAQQGDIYVALNANKEARKVKLPEGVYHILCYNGRIDADGTQQMAFRNGHDEVNVPAQSALILMEVNR